MSEDSLGGRRGRTWWETDRKCLKEPLECQKAKEELALKSEGVATRVLQAVNWLDQLSKGGLACRGA